MRELPTELDPKGKYLALENLQDPSNLGAVCRTAEALGLSGLIVSGGCDLYNPKALRAAMGSSLRIPIIETRDIVSLLCSATANGMHTYASVPRSDAVDIRKADLNGGVIICVGNEGSGLSQSTICECETAVTIPMGGRAESFNASAAAAILAWELMR
ncbi:MAG: RNA methyltransferase [Clostridia bacterium]|nr:RNA methyltransferase [Clostridia bacterium]